MLEFGRSTFDQCVMRGKAWIRGVGVTVSLVVNPVANGMGTKMRFWRRPVVQSLAIQDLRQWLQKRGRGVRSPVVRLGPGLCSQYNYRPGSRNCYQSTQSYPRGEQLR